MDDNRKSMYGKMRNLINEGKLKFPDNTSLFNALRERPHSNNAIVFPDGNFVASDPAFEPLKPLFVKIHYGQMYISDIPDVDIDEIVYQTFWDMLTNKQQNQLTLPYWGDTPNISTASFTEKSSLNTGILKDIIDRLPKNPLLEKGVQRDWVCVINPALVSHIEGFYEAHKPKHFQPGNKLDYVMGRKVHIINEAPLDLQYMPEEVMRRMYSEHFLRQLELLAKLEAELKDNSDATDNSHSQE